jgi:hypothetical protein
MPPDNHLPSLILVSRTWALGGSSEYVKPEWRLKRRLIMSVKNNRNPARDGLKENIDRINSVGPILHSLKDIEPDTLFLVLGAYRYLFMRLSIACLDSIVAKHNPGFPGEFPVEIDEKAGGTFTWVEGLEPNKFSTQPDGKMDLEAWLKFSIQMHETIGETLYKQVIEAEKNALALGKYLKKNFPKK